MTKETTKIGTELVDTTSFEGSINGGSEMRNNYNDAKMMILVSRIFEKL